MKMTLSLAVLALMLSVSAAEATFIRGTFTGVVTAEGSLYPPYTAPELAFPLGTPAWAIFGYDSDYLSPPDAFGNRWVSDKAEYDGFFYGTIGDMGFWTGFNTGSPENPASGYLVIGPNGLPSWGGGNGTYDTGVFSNGFRFTTINLVGYVEVEGTYTLPEHHSTLTPTIVGLMALAVARCFVSRVPSV
jgi:hypothetical protein